MSLIDFTIPNLYNGVSQQPVTVRLPNQLEEQINGFSSVTNGLSKRNGTRLLRRTRLKNPANAEKDLIRGTTVIKTMVAVDNTGSEVKYQVIINTQFGHLWINRLTYPATTSLAATEAYLQGNRADFKIINDGNTVYILNKGVKVLGADVEDDSFKAQGSLVNVYAGSLNNEYNITVRLKDLSGAYYPDTVSASTSIAYTETVLDKIKPVSIAAALMTDLVAKLAAKAVGPLEPLWGGITVNRSLTSSWLQIKDTRGNIVEVTASTTNAKNMIFAINTVVKDVLELPNGPVGYNVRVDADPTSGKDDYFLTYSAEENQWVEAPKKGTVTSTTASTRPIIIKDVLAPIIGGPEVYVSRLGFSVRESGDMESNPMPSFVGQKINDIFLFNNRFGILAGTNVVMSKIDDYSMFFRTSNAAVLGSDRIDIKASLPSSRGTPLKYAIPYDNEIVITSETAQYSLKSNAAFDPKTASLSTLTEYNIDTSCAPINIGTSIYMASKRANASSVLDFSRRADVGMLAEDITEHIPSYLRGQLMDMTTSTVQGVLFLRTYYEEFDSVTGDLIDSTNNIIYVQNRFIRNSELKQNAWHKWTFPNEEIVGIDVIGTKLFISATSRYVDGIDNFKDLFVYEVDFSVNELGTTEALNTINFIPHLDGLLTATKYLLNFAGASIFTSNPDDVETYKYFVPFGAENKVVMVTDKGQIIRGITNINTFVTEEIIPDITISVNTIYYIGYEFDHSFTFSEQVVASYENGEKQVNQHSNMLLRNMKLSFKNSGKFDVVIKPKGRDSFTQSFSGMILGDPSATLGKINIATGTFKFTIGTRPDSVKITVTSNYPFPTSFNTAEWQASIVTRSGRL